MAASTARIVLGSLLLHPEWHELSSSKLGELGDACFGADKFDAALWETLNDLAKKDVLYTPIDALAATAKAEFADDLKQIRRLLDLSSAETKETFERRVAALREETYHRLALGGMQRLTQQASETGAEFDWLGTLDKARDSLGRKAKTSTNYEALTKDRVLETLSASRRKQIIPTGFASIDRECGGYIVGKTLLVMARTNAGKSSTLYALARNQLFPNSSDNIEQSMGVHRNTTYSRRLEPGWPQQDKKPAPHVLLLSVEDDVDDYIGRGICDLVNVFGQDYLNDAEQAIYADGKAKDFEVFAERFSSGRLTIADYENADGTSEKTIEQIEATISGWSRRVRSAAKEAGEDDPPLLVLLDYFQKLESPEDEEKRMQERQILAKVSNRLYTLAKKKKFALCMAVMLLRGDDHIEPDMNTARGGSDVTQDADSVWTLWPFGGGERRAIQAAAAGKPIGEPEPEPEQESADEDPFADDGNEMFEVDEAGPTISIDARTSRRAVGELLITCDKGRHSAAGWRVPLFFQRDHKRITEAHDFNPGSSDTPRVVYRNDASIGKLLKAARKHKAKK